MRFGRMIVFVTESNRICAESGTCFMQTTICMLFLGSNRLNATPRKCLGYNTPAEVFRQKLLAQIRRTG